MKRILLLLLLLPPAFGARAQEAAAMPSAFSEMMTKLSVMHYLDQAAMSFLLNGFREDTAVYYRGVLQDNPVPSFDINAYLGFSAAPAEPASFMNAVAEKNAAALLEIIEQYGFPSYSRLKPFVKNSNSLNAAVFIDRAPEPYKKKFRQALRDQFDEGNMTRREYNTCLKSVKSEGIFVADQVAPPVMVAGVRP